MMTALPLIQMLLTAGADKMAQTDPHGFTLTLVSVCIVFSGLIILYFIFSFIGEIFEGRIRLPRRKPAESVRTSEAASVPAEEEATAAAIALALHLCLGEQAHDVESGVITLREAPSPWGDKSLNFRKKPSK